MTLQTCVILQKNFIAPKQTKKVVTDQIPNNSDPYNGAHKVRASGFFTTPGYINGSRNTNMFSDPEVSCLVCIVVVVLCVLLLVVLCVLLLVVLCVLLQLSCVYCCSCLVSIVVSCLCVLL